ncbi:hypothetical protein VTI28DRAFT_4239 [Corynascus sepedonium]
MATVTTSLHLDPSCYAPSNLWLDVRPGGYGCNTYYPPFSSRPTNAVTIKDCPFVRLGPPFAEVNTNPAASSCSPYGTDIATAYSDCPEGFTGADTKTTSWLDGITIVGTTCCPSAYDFSVGHSIPTPIPSVIDGTTWPVTMSTAYMCKAASIKDFSDQQVTLTVPGSPLATTELEWDYENGFVVAESARVLQWLYPDYKAGTTSTCYGRCPSETNPLNHSPIPTPHPTGTYIPPPSAPVTQFTPAPSCLDESNLWLISADCYLDENGASPPWLECTYTAAGDPDPTNPACYPVSTATSTDGGPKTFYSACPAGYTPALSRTRKPFDLPLYADTKTKTFDAVATAHTCCPAAFGGDSDGNGAIPFTYSMVHTTKTVHNGDSHGVFVYALPWCVASRVSRLDGETVTLGLYSDARVWDRKVKRQGIEYGTTTAVWDAAHDTLFAQAPQVSWTVFHGTYTCYEGCDDYFTYSYGNTDPNYTPSPTPTVATRGVDGSGKSDAPASTAAAPAAMGRGDVQGGMLSVVVVVVTVVHVAVGALL